VETAIIATQAVFLGICGEKIVKIG